MTLTHRAIGVLVAVALAGTARSVHAQHAEPSRVSAEGVAAVSMFSSWSQPAIILDGTAAVRVNDRSVVLVRPWVWKRDDGSWTAEWYQLQVRYETRTRIPFRVDAGIMPSPLGLATLEYRPDLNPTVSPPFYYFIPLPKFDTTFDGVQAMSSGYPFGALVSTSGQRWDARGGITTGTPAYARAELKSGEPRTMPQFVLGGGVTPLAGLRMGGGFAYGKYRDARTSPLTLDSSYAPGTIVVDAAGLVPAAHATVTNLEAEYAFGHTRLKGEWVWDRFETTTSPKIATAFFAQAAHTFSPRWFGAARLTSVDAPTPTAVRTRATVAEAIAGYRVTRSLTLRGGYYTNRYYRAPQWDREVCVSLVWSGRWN